MNDNFLNRLSIFITATWLLIMIYRLVAFGGIGTAADSTAKQVTDAVIIIIAIFLILVLLRRFVKYSIAKTKKETHCQQCYAYIPPDEEFCPKCGWSRDPSYNKEK